MTATHRMNLVLWAVILAGLGGICLVMARWSSLCYVTSEATLAEEAPSVWWLAAVMSAVSFGAAVLMLAMARDRSDQAPCPHCGKPVEPRITMMGDLKVVAPSRPPAPPPPAAPAP